MRKCYAIFVRICYWLLNNKGIAFAVYFKEVHADVGLLPFKITILLQDEHSIPYCD